MPGHSGGTNWGAVAADPDSGELFVLSKALPTMIRLVMPGVSEPGTSRTGRPTIVGATKRRGSRSEAGDALLKGPVRFTSPYDFMFTSTYLVADRSTVVGNRRLRSQHRRHQVAGAARQPSRRRPEIGIPPTSGAHWPRGGLLLTGGGLLFAASGSDKTFRAYDRRTGQVIWTYALPAASDGVPASYEAGGRQYILVPVAAANGWNAARFPTLPPAPEGSYMAFALPK